MSRFHYGDYAVFLAGKGHFGDAEEVQLPDLEWKGEDFSGGGGLGTREFGMILNKLEMSIKLNSYENDIYAQALPAPGQTTTFKVVGSLIVPGEEEAPLKITVTGALQKLNRDGLKAGSKTIATATFRDIIYYEEVKDGVQMYEIDLLNQVLRVNGQDRLAVRRRNLGR